MLQEIKEKNSIMFVEHFNQAFDEKYEIECEWGFPVLSIKLISKNPEYDISWHFNIDVVKPDYVLQVYGAKLQSEGESQLKVAEPITIDKSTIDFIIGRSIYLTNLILGEEEEKEEAPVEEKQESS